MASVKFDEEALAENPAYTAPVEDAASDDAPTQSLFWRRFWLAAKVLALVGAITFTGIAFSLDAGKAVTLLYFWAFVGVIALCLFLGRKFDTQVTSAFMSVDSFGERLSNSRPLAIACGLAGVLAMALIVGLCVAGTVDWAQRLIGLLGLLSFVLISWASSFKPREVKWRPVVGGILMQFVFGLIVLRTSWGFDAFDFLGTEISKLLDYVNAGTQFVFGGVLGAPPGIIVVKDLAGNDVTLFFFKIFAVNILPTVIFFSALVSIMYHVGILQVIVRVIGRAIALCLGTSAAESLNAAGSIFIGQTEAPLMIRPFLADMTDSELHAVMTAGFATIAGGVLAVYISFGISASSLLAASVMSAPASVAISKLIMPETQVAKSRPGEKFVIDAGETVNIFDAAAQGAAVAVQLALNIGGQLIAFISLVAFANATLGYFGAYVGYPELTFQLICRYLFYPLAYLMGCDEADCLKVGELIGTKIVLNEFVAYQQLSTFIAKGEISKRSELIATYALCGFSNFGSIGIQVGGLTPLAPNKRGAIARLVFSAMLAGNWACFMTASIAGCLYDPARL
jgi:nucleoside transporter